MSTAAALDWRVFQPIATTVLYEGHILYPYRPSALKNRQQWNFGTLFPPAWREEPSALAMQVLIEGDVGGDAAPVVELRLCFLLGGEEYAVGSGTTVLGGVRCQLDWQLEAMTGIDAGLWKLSAHAANLTTAPADASREAMLEWALQSAHLRCGVRAGAFVSAQDPGLHQQAADTCRCQGVYPVLIGPPGERRYLLAAPIILEDHPRIAPQSQGDFCDATEMDELLTLRVATLTAAEKAEVRAAGGAALAILERCERSGALDGLHAGLDARPAWEAFTAPPEMVRVGAAEVRVGDRVRIRSGDRPGRDLFDQVLDGRIARVQAIEQDLEGALHLAVVAEDDPGRDLGELRQTGHRFFFSPTEVEPL